MSTFDAHVNLVRCAVAVAPVPADSGTTLTVAAGQGARFPAVPFNATLFPTPTLASPYPTLDTAEIVRITAMTGDVVTAMTRAQEGTTEKVIVAGWQIEDAATVKTFTDIEAVASLATTNLANLISSLGTAAYVATSTFDAAGLAAAVQGNLNSLAGGLGSAAFVATSAFDVAGAAAAVTPTTLGLVIGSNVLAYRTFGTAANSAATDFDTAGLAAAVQSNLGTHAGLTGTAAHGLGTASTHAATDFDVAGAAAAITPTTLGLVIGTNTQAHGVKLDAIQALASAAGWLHNDGAGVFTYSTPTYSQVGADAAGAAAAVTPTTLGLVIGTNVEAHSAALSAITAATWTGASSITTVGTLASGAVPASLVTAGSLGAGDYTVTGNLTLTKSVLSTTAVATPGAYSATQMAMFASTVSGAATMGYGTTHDASLKNRAGTTAFGILANNTAAFLAEATTVPTGAVTGGGNLFVNGGELCYLTTAGVQEMLLSAGVNMDKPTAAISQTMPRYSALGIANLALVSGRLRFQAIWLPAGATITSITWSSGAPALVLGSSPHLWFALYNSSLGLLRQSTDNTSAAWAANALLTQSLSSPFITTYSGLYYVGAMMVCGAGGTMVGLGCLNTRVETDGLAPKTEGELDSSLTTTAPNPATWFAHNGKACYAYVS